MKRSLALLSGALLFAGTSLAVAQTQTGSAPQNQAPQGSAATQQPAGSPNGNSSKSLSTSNPNSAVPGSSASNASPSGAGMNQPNNARMAGNKSREEIQQVQQALNQNGDRVRVDGVLGRKTREAIRDFQQKNGLQASGRLDQQTLQKLNVATR
ncbi:MAG TPA: peptidoglycan-binding domain-containing protein [Candidatus Binataceae bacterium]|nr:peptidoglycan-binding domain-containing protein [Candidatus Binataceae bacterium]